jgi:hypothetical protein
MASIPASAGQTPWRQRFFVTLCLRVFFISADNLHTTWKSRNHEYTVSEFSAVLTVFVWSKAKVANSVASFPELPNSSLSYFSETSVFWTDFRNILKYQISWKSVNWEPICSIRTDRRIEMTKLIVAFVNFAKRVIKITVVIVTRIVEQSLIATFRILGNTWQ